MNKALKILGAFDNNVDNFKETLEIYEILIYLVAVCFGVRFIHVFAL